MWARRLPNGNLLIPVRAAAGKLPRDTYHELSPDNPHYERWLAWLHPADRGTAAPATNDHDDVARATVTEATAGMFGYEAAAPVVVDAGWLSQELWQAVRGKQG